MKIVLFDVCGTLYRSNTTYDFLKFYFHRRNIFKALFLQVLLSKPFKIIWLLIRICFPSYNIRAFLISFIKNERVSEVEKAANDFVDNFLSTRESSVLAMLKKFKADDSNVIVLCSASIEPVIKAIAGHLRIEVYGCTKLEKKGEFFTGRIELDVQGKKYEWVMDSFRLKDFSEVIFFTDNVEDIPLMKHANRKFVVAKGRRKEYWKHHVKDVEFIDPRS